MCSELGAAAESEENLEDITEDTQSTAEEEQQLQNKMGKVLCLLN